MAARARALVAPGEAAFAPLTGVQPVARYESAVINRRVDRDADGLLQAALVARDGSWITKGVVDELPRRRRRLRDDRDDVARAARARP